MLHEEALKHNRFTNETVTKEVGRCERIMSTMDVFMK